jgi:hypothetical protein
MTRREQDTARRILRDLGILKEQLKGSPPVVYFAVDFEVLDCLLMALPGRKKKAQKPASDMAENAISICTKTPNQFVRKRQNIITENTNNITPISPKKSTRRLTDEEWFDELKKDPEYSGLDIDKAVADCLGWCERNSAVFGRTRLRNWLKKAERPLQLQQTRKPTIDELYPKFTGYIKMQEDEDDT